MVSQFSSVYISSRVVRSNSCSCVYRPNNMKLNTQQTVEILHFNNTSTQIYIILLMSSSSATTFTTTTSAFLSSLSSRSNNNKKARTIKRNVVRAQEQHDDVNEDGNEETKKRSSSSRRSALINASAATLAMVIPSSFKTSSNSGSAFAASSSSLSSNTNENEFADAKSMQMLRREGEFSLTDEEWRERLSNAADTDPFAYQVLRKAATERPLSSPLYTEKRVGTYVCAGCENPLFSSETKYDSGTGWPSFYDHLPNAVTEVPDFSIMFLPRTETRCKRCQGHLGHSFEDGPKPTGIRYCMNGAALKFVAKDV